MGVAPTGTLLQQAAALIMIWAGVLWGTAGVTM